MAAPRATRNTRCQKETRSGRAEQIASRQEHSFRFIVHYIRVTLDQSFVLSADPAILSGYFSWKYSEMV